MATSLVNEHGYFDIEVSAQLFSKDVVELIKQGGWEMVGKYRSFSPLQVAGKADPYRKAFSEVHLFESIGSDKQTRRFGMIIGHGGKVRNYVDAPVIPNNTELGKLVTDGDRKVFTFPVKPFYPGSVVVYDANGDIVAPAEVPYLVDGEAGTITFNNAYAGELTATYSLRDNAPDLVRRLWFFLYDDMIPTKTVIRSDNPEESRLEDLSNGVFKFPIVEGNQRIKENSYTLYETLDGITPIPPNEYTVDHDKGTVKFNDTEPTQLFGDFDIEYVKDENNDYGDIEVGTFDPQDPKSVTGAAYNAMRYIYPSMPTAVSLIPDDEIGLGWGRDAQIYFWGNITKDRIVAYFRLDPAPNPPGTYFAPLYVGRLATIGKAPRGNTLLVGGAREKDEIKYDTGLKIGNYTVDYGLNTSNGNSSVMLHSTIGGAKYQKHYLAFITHDAEIDPTREGRFNPSAYSDKYHVAPMFVVHPSDGYVGRFDEVYAIHPKNIAQLEELDVDEQANREFIGTSDGANKEYFLYHTPVIDADLEILIVDGETCTTLTEADYVEGTPGEGQFTVTKDKKVIFGTAYPQGAEFYATYNYRQIYRFILADTPRAPYTLATVTPYAPIGLGFLKENAE